MKEEIDDFVAQVAFEIEEAILLDVPTVVCWLGLIKDIDTLQQVCIEIRDLGYPCAFVTGLQIIVIDIR